MEWTEELGFDSIWLTEHHFIDYGLSVDPASARRGRRLRTRRVRIGLAAAILPFHHPLRLAEQMALVDIICAAAGSTWAWAAATARRSSTAYRVPQIENRERFDEARGRSCCRRGPRSASPTRAASSPIPEVRVIPKPLQRPHPPLYQVCVSQDGIEATALRGLAHAELRPASGRSISSISQRDTYVNAAARHGRSDGGDRRAARPLGRVAPRSTWRPPTREALAETKDAEMWYQESLRKFVIPERIERRAPAAAAGLPRHGRAVRPGDVGRPGARDRRLRLARHGGARASRACAQLGVGQVLCWMNFGGLPQDRSAAPWSCSRARSCPAFGELASIRRAPDPATTGATSCSASCR